MSGSLKNKQHLVRMAGLFVVGIVAFFVLRWWMVPKSFGEYGHYRGAALAEIAARPMHYAGRAACEECHTDIVAKRKGSPHERIGCETCHGPQLAHVEAGGDQKPPLPDSRNLCPKCHAASPFRPKGFPQVVVADHAPSGPCTACHDPHSPKIS
jgi:hypothetical protein